MGTDPEHKPIDVPDDDDIPLESSSTSPGDLESRSIKDPLGNTVSFELKPNPDDSSGSSLAQPPQSSVDIPTTLGRFKINGVLGKGGFGTVYLGFDERLKRSVAIKVPTQILSGLELDKFLEEAQRLAQLRHAGIVTVFDVGEFEGRCYIVSDYLEGVSLAQWMKSRTHQWTDAALIVSQLADALSHAHSQGTIHRDIKPSNVMMLSDNQPVVIDFGLAISDAHGQSESPGTIAGTVAYMSPEQASGKGHRIDGRTDIYGLGVVLYHMLCHKRPFGSNETLELIRQIREDEPQPPRQIAADIPVELEQACLKAISKRIDDRFTTAADFAEALRQIIQHSGEEKTAKTRADLTVNKHASGTLDSRSDSRSTSRMHEAERRQITTLYLDLDDSEIDADLLDPEELRSVVQRIREITARILAKYDGHFAQSNSEAIQVYFGYPLAQEDSVRKSILAALEIGSEITKLQRRCQQSQDLVIEFRIGIHTGIVVTEEITSEVSSERHSIVGNVPRVAAGLAALAEPGSVVVSGTTQQIAGNEFCYESAGTHSGKAIGRNVDLYKVISVNDSAAGSLAEEFENQTPLVGREHETGLFNERWKQVTNGMGQVILVSSEAGVGKSRLLSACRQGLRLAEQQCFDARCSPYHQNSALNPINELLVGLAQLNPADSDESRLEKLEDLLRRYDIPLEQVIPLFVDLVAIPLGPRYPVFEGTPERRKQRTIEALVELLFAASENQPLLFTIEDLHWADPTTLEFLTILMEQLPSVPILLVATYRPEFTSPWNMQTGLTQLKIGNLTPEQTADVVARIAGDRKLPAEVIDHIVAKTGGVPLFTEELTKVILESDILAESGDKYILSRPLQSVNIPGTLQNSLMARLDRLGPAKELAQLASVIGREFTFKLLAQIAPLDEQTIQSELTALVNAELIHQRGFFPRARFTFKHALVQDTAYASLLRSDRRKWHGLIADVLAAEFSEISKTDPALLAHHYTEAGQTITAIGYWEQAGLQAQEQSANHEAISHFRAGRALVDTLEPSEERDGLEFKLQVPFGVALLATQGYAAPEVGPVFERAEELGQKLAGPDERFFILWGIWAWRVVREELQICKPMADEAQTMVEPLGDAGLQAEALFIPALTSFYLGDFATSLKSCQQGFELYEEETAKLYSRFTGQNVGVTIQCYWALSLWHLGYPDQAIERIDKAVELGRAVNHPFSLAYALCHSGWIYHNVRRSAEVARDADAGIEISKEQGFPFWMAESLLHKGFGLLLDQQPEESLQMLQAGLDVFNMTGANLSLCHFQAIFAEAHLLAGNLEQSLQRIDDATESSKINGNAFFLAEIHRLRGEIMLANDQIDEAESCFQESLEIARSQQAKSWELRTAMSLCRLWQSQNRGKQAYALLADVYQWFQEGFDTGDLAEAKQLLEQLK